MEIKEHDYHIVTGYDEPHLVLDDVERLRLRDCPCTIIWDKIGSCWNVVPDEHLRKLVKLSFGSLEEAVRAARGRVWRA